MWAATAPENVAELRSSWMVAVRAHPRDYLRHRWAMTRTLIGLGPHVWYPYHFQIDSNPFGITLAETAQNRAAMQFLNWVHDSILFRGWAYLALLIVAAIRCVVRGIRACWASSLATAIGPDARQRMPPSASGAAAPVASIAFAPTSQAA